MEALPWLNKLVGVRSQEVRTVWLFFWHSFLLGVGTILVYVAANAILLENHPETSLPVAYIISALLMMGIGKVYSHYEHHLALSNLANRVLGAVVILTAVIGILIWVGHSVTAAVAIMAGYRAIYLLTNLEFWGVSAVVFDTRQGKRLFGVISAGDMPAKALGAVLAALVHAHTDILLLLIVSFGCFLLAMYVLQRTFQAHEVHTSHRPPRKSRRVTPQFIDQLFGGSELVFFMCLSLAALAAVATEIEYNFFINVKHKFHSQGEVITYVSYVLALTYGLAMAAKLILSHQALDRFGVRRSLLVLPVLALAGVLGLSAMARWDADETQRLIYFCGLYLTFEVARRALFDPVFLVLFQPLSPAQRLKGHTLAKGFYEPLGLGFAGVMIAILHSHPRLEIWVPLVWAILLVVAIILLRRTYHYYLNELNDAIGQRFLEGGQLAMPTAALQGVIANLTSSKPENVLAAIGWLSQRNSAELSKQAANLLDHPNPLIRRRTLDAISTNSLHIPAKLLNHCALTDSEPALRELAAYLLSNQPDVEALTESQLVHHTDLAIRQGAIRGVLQRNPIDTSARQSLDVLSQSTDSASRLAALHIIGSTKLASYAPVVATALQEPVLILAKAAGEAAGQLTDANLTRQLVGLLTDKSLGRTAVSSLKARGAAALPLLATAVHQPISRLLASRIAAVCAAIQTADSRRLLTELAQRPDLGIRLLAGHALTRFKPQPDDSGVFKRLMQAELTHAQRLIHGMEHADIGLADSLDYDLSVLIQRLFGWLAQLYDQEAIAHAWTGISHPARERRANALELLDNLIPRPVYQTLQALIDPHWSRTEKVRIVDAEVGSFRDTEPIVAYILRQGEAEFSDWSVSMALRQITPGAANVEHLIKYLNHPLLLFRESAAIAFHAFQQQHPVDYKHLLIQFPLLSPLLMSHASATQSHISDIELILALKSTSLFAQTPENVLSSVTPILREVTYQEGDVIFNKGDLGTDMFIIYAGDVGIFDQSTQLARFSKGDFFGELALLDAEARSASAEALTDVRLLRLDQEDFYDLMEERGEILRSIIRTLSGRIRRLNAQLTAAPVLDEANK